MSDSHDADVNHEAELEADVEILSELLSHEFRAVERAASKLRETSALAKELDADDLVGALSQLRLARAMDDFTSIYLDLKDEEADAARELLQELGDDEAGYDDEFEDDEFEDEFDEDDDFGVFDEDDED
jgi:hypothetical protein